MSLEFVKQSSSADYWKLNATVRINTVNCVGVMGKGIALEFKQRHQSMFLEYLDRCKLGMLEPGGIFQYQAYHYWVINVATKHHWKHPSKLEWVESGLERIRDVLKLRESRALDVVAMPALGCGNGGLDWSVVQQLMILKLSDLKSKVVVFEPMEISRLF